MSENMNHFYIKEIEDILSRGYNEIHNPDIMGVIYSLGRDAENNEEYQFAAGKLLQIFDGGTDGVRAYCILAFSLLAVSGFSLDRDRIAPLIIQERKRAEGKNLQIINDAIEDIEMALGWRLEER